MTETGEVRFAGRAKWGEVAAYLLMAVVGVILVVAVFTEVPSDVHAMRVLGWYTATATALTALLALALASLSRLPALRPTRIGGEPAVGVRTWPWARAYDLALDVGLAATLLTVAGIGVAAGNGWLVPSLLVAGVGAWFAVKFAYAVGRGHPEALWLTDRHVVHDSPSGRERCDRDTVISVRPVSRFVIIKVDGPVDRRVTPRLWRRPSAVVADPHIWFDTEKVGHTPEQLTGWLREELGVDEHGRRTPPPEPRGFLGRVRGLFG